MDWLNSFANNSKDVDLEEARSVIYRKGKQPEVKFFEFSSDWAEVDAPGRLERSYMG